MIFQFGGRGGGVSSFVTSHRHAQWAGPPCNSLSAVVDVCCCSAGPAEELTVSSSVEDGVARAHGAACWPPSHHRALFRLDPG